MFGQDGGIVAMFVFGMVKDILDVICTISANDTISYMTPFLKHRDIPNMELSETGSTNSFAILKFCRELL